MSRPKVAVIGSGFGGLALAVRLQAAGADTTLVESRDRPGGRAYVYHDHGFTFDAGPTVITAPTALEEVFATAARNLHDYVELMPVRPFYQLCWEDGYRFDYTDDLEAINRQIAQKSPADVEGYARFRRYAEEVFVEGYEKLAHVPFLDWWSMIRVAPKLFRLKSYRSVYDVVAGFIEHPQLREAFSFHSLLVGGNPFQTSAIYTLIHALERKWGVYFPRGGTGALVEAFVRLLQELGGTVRLNTKVETIQTRDGAVCGLQAANGWSGEFDAVASNVDVV
jgi:phytoene desaturase